MINFEQKVNKFRYRNKDNYRIRFDLCEQGEGATSEGRQGNEGELKERQARIGNKNIDT
ncbi:hypothetical protein B1no1_26660 [Thermolongibacillus altinsuensis]|nr:hypothetical protein B1no1_26660 [Thermolongibacillus altinsuensis]